MIATGSYPPGVPLREVDLVRHFRVSRTPIREALHRLHSEGMLKPLPGGGFLAPHLGPKELADIYKLRGVLEGLSAREAAQHRSVKDIERLELIMGLIEKGSPAAISASDPTPFREFFHTIARASHNEYLNAALTRIGELYRYRSVALTYPEWYDNFRDRHREIVKTIIEQRASRSERLVRAYFAKALAIRIEQLSLENENSVASMRKRRQGKLVPSFD